ncbi:major core protein [Chenuda virus]|uniref:Core protein VP7 n=1 Tax=Chenuda virus TaxID=40065 RepID=A0A0H4MKD1_9REOV|nr:major core protein [Chenuda virus]AKP24092.1 major core protein [Chenuda virus]
MDAYNARALSVLEGLALAADPRAHRDPVSETTLSIFMMRFNSTTTRPIVGAPTTREARRNNFYAALDVAYAALGITSQFLMPGYVQNPQTLAILARDEIPYTPSTFRRVQRIRICSEGACTFREEYFPYQNYTMLTGRAMPINPPADGGPRCYLVDPNTVQVHVEPEQTIAVTDVVVPTAPNWVAAELAWYIQTNGPGANAAEGYAQDVDVYVNDRRLPAGLPYRLNPGDRVELTNHDDFNLGTAMFFIRRYWSAAPPQVIYDSMEADICAVYIYHDRTWHRLRSYICTQVGLPPTYYPSEATQEPRRVLTIAILSRLFDVYCALSPEIHLPAPEVAPGDLAQRLREALQTLRGAPPPAAPRGGQ